MRTAGIGALVLAMFVASTGCSSPDAPDADLPSPYAGTWANLGVRWNDITYTPFIDVVVDEDGNFGASSGGIILTGSITDDGTFSASANRCADVTETSTMSGSCTTTSFCSATITGSCTSASSQVTFER